MVWSCLSIRPGLCPSVRHSFPHFSPTSFDILIWNFVYDFIFMHVRSSSSVVNFRRFLWELCPFWNLKYCQYAVFCTFLLHALTYWAGILHKTLFYCTTDQVQGSSICVNFCGSYALFGTWNTGNTQYSHFSLTCFDILNWTFTYDFVFTVLQIKCKCHQFSVMRFFTKRMI